MRTPCRPGIGTPSVTRTPRGTPSPATDARASRTPSSSMIRSQLTPKLVDVLRVFIWKNLPKAEYLNLLIVIKTYCVVVYLFNVLFMTGGKIEYMCIIKIQIIVPLLYIDLRYGIFKKNLNFIMLTFIQKARTWKKCFENVVSVNHVIQLELLYKSQSDTEERFRRAKTQRKQA